MAATKTAAPAAAKTPEEIATEAAIAEAEAAEKEVPAAPPAQKEATQEVTVFLLKDLDASMGYRIYKARKGAEILMDPSHAETLAQNGWISIVG
jgi:hypothetical protein